MPRGILFYCFNLQNEFFEKLEKFFALFMIIQFRRAQLVCKIQDTVWVIQITSGGSGLPETRNPT